MGKQSFFFSSLWVHAFLCVVCLPTKRVMAYRRGNLCITLNETEIRAARFVTLVIVSSAVAESCTSNPLIGSSHDTFFLRRRLIYQYSVESPVAVGSQTILGLCWTKFDPNISNGISH